jgi:hypothetical protein
VDASKLSSEEKQTRSNTMLLEMRQALERATKILGEARSTKDVQQLNCINEKLTQIKGLLRIAEQASVKMFQAIAERADDVTNGEFTKMTVASQKVHVLRAEADQCVGEQSIYAGDTEVQVEINPDIRAGDPTATPPPGIAPITPPVASSL